MALLLAVVAIPAQAQGTADAESAGQQEVDEQLVERSWTRGELQREIAEAQRLLEELILVIESQEQPTPEQTQQLQKLSRQIAEYTALLGQMEEAAKPAPQDQGIKARWSRFRQATEDITRYDINDGMFRFQIGVRLQIDATLASESELLEAEVGTIGNDLSLRRARVFAEGRILRRMDFKFEYDGAVDDGVKDAYLEGGRWLRFAKWRIGQFKEPFSLARQTSGNYLDFLEWALPVQALAPGRNWGLMLRHAELHNRLYWSFAAMTRGKTTDDNRDASKVTLTGRVSGLPIHSEDGKRLLHIGLSYSARKPSGASVSYFARPEARFAPVFIDTGDIPADKTTLVGVEVAGSRDSFWAQAEWIQASVDASGGSTFKFAGYYVEAGYFLTGETRVYQTIDGTVGRQRPDRLFRKGNPFKRGTDGGALEVTLRYSTLDLNDGRATGGKLDDVSAGLNWYLTPATRVMLNYIYSDVADGGSANLVLLRYQFNP